MTLDTLSFPCFPAYSGMVFRGGQGIATVRHPASMGGMFLPRNESPSYLCFPLSGPNWLFRCNWSELESDR
jgi:hypothetical protein